MSLPGAERRSYPYGPPAAALGPAEAPSDLHPPALGLGVGSPRLALATELVGQLRYFFRHGVDLPEPLREKWRWESADPERPGELSLPTGPSSGVVVEYRGADLGDQGKVRPAVYVSLGGSQRQPLVAGDGRQWRGLEVSGDLVWIGSAAVHVVARVELEALQVADCVAQHLAVVALQLAGLAGLASLAVTGADEAVELPDDRGYDCPVPLAWQHCQPWTLRHQGPGIRRVATRIATVPDAGQ